MNSIIVYMYCTQNSARVWCDLGGGLGVVAGQGVKRVEDGV